MAKRGASPIDDTLRIVGDRWSILIVRAGLRGIRRFDDLCSDLGIARPILTERLRRLVAHGVMETRRYSERPPRHEYWLTQKGLALSPVLLTMAEWGDRHVYGRGHSPVLFSHKTCGCEFHPVLACEACGEVVQRRDLERVPPYERGLTVGEALEAAKMAAE